MEVVCLVWAVNIRSSNAIYLFVGFNCSRGFKVQIFKYSVVLVCMIEKVWLSECLTSRADSVFCLFVRLTVYCTGYQAS